MDKPNLSDLSNKELAMPVTTVADNAQSLLDAGATQFSPGLIENLIRAHNQCCVQNKLLLSRINKLQHKLDTRK